MNILNKPRRSGKTTELIYASEATGFPIIACKGFNHAEAIKIQAAVQAYTGVRIAALTVSIEMTGNPIEKEGTEDDGE